MSAAPAAAVAQIGVGDPLTDLANRTRPVSLAHQQRLAVSASLSALFPEGVQRGSTVVVGAARAAPAGGQGATSLALGLLAGVSETGGWCAVVGLPSLGLVAAAQLGLRLERVALVPQPGAQWPLVAGALVDSVDVVLLAPSERVAPSDARRLAARARERGAVMVVLASSWPDRGDLYLTVGSVTCSGLGVGQGFLQGRRAEVILSGRGAAARERRTCIWLPAPGDEAG